MEKAGQSWLGRELSIPGHGEVSGQEEEVLETTLRSQRGKGNN